MCIGIIYLICRHSLCDLFHFHFYNQFSGLIGPTLIRYYINDIFDSCVIKVFLVNIWSKSIIKCECSVCIFNNYLWLFRHCVQTFFTFLFYFTFDERSKMYAYPKCIFNHFYLYFILLFNKYLFDFLNNIHILKNYIVARFPLKILNRIA